MPLADRQSAISMSINEHVACSSYTFYQLCEGFSSPGRDRDRSSSQYTELEDAARKVLSQHAWNNLDLLRKGPWKLTIVMFLQRFNCDALRSERFVKRLRDLAKHNLALDIAYKLLKEMRDIRMETSKSKKLWKPQDVDHVIKAVKGSTA